MWLASSLALFVVGGVSCLPAAFAWGAAGHEIVATIAQIYLHPSVLPALCGSILDQDESACQCHLAPIATWADKYKYRMGWSAALHYVGSIDGHPPDNCAYPGPNGWAGTKEINVLDGIKNVTELLQDWVNHDASDYTANEALKFLVHFVGDMHQPLHLTNYNRGGNLAKVTWDGNQTNIHSTWDDFLVAKAVRTVPQNYSMPLPYPKIEGALRGAIYDSYIRRIMWEGTLNKWADELQDWLSCPIPESSTSPIVEVEGTWQKALSGSSNIYTQFTTTGVEINPDGDVVCPYFWSQPLNALNCDFVWPKGLNVKSGEDALLELDTPEYAGVIEQRMLLEKFLAQGGIRLAGLLNHLFADLGDVKGAFVINPKA